MPAIYEYFWVKIEYCIVNKIKYNKLSTFTAYSPDTPIEYDIYGNIKIVVPVAKSYDLVPSCVYTL